MDVLRTGESDQLPASSLPISSQFESVGVDGERRYVIGNTTPYIASSATQFQSTEVRLADSLRAKILLTNVFLYWILLYDGLLVEVRLTLCHLSVHAVMGFTVVVLDFFLILVCTGRQIFSISVLEQLVKVILLLRQGE